MCFVCVVALLECNENAWCPSHPSLGLVFLSYNTIKSPYRHVRTRLYVT